MNCVGVFDVLTFDSSQTNHLALMPQYQVLCMMLPTCSQLHMKSHHINIMHNVQMAKVVSHTCVVYLFLKMGC